MKTLFLAFCVYLSDFTSASHGKHSYGGQYSGKCSEDGVYYNDQTSIVMCSNGIAYYQRCAPGTKNSGVGHYAHGKQYGVQAFCDVNLVDHGYGIRHGYGHGGGGYGGYSAGHRGHHQAPVRYGHSLSRHRGTAGRYDHPHSGHLFKTAHHGIHDGFHGYGRHGPGHHGPGHHGSGHLGRDYPHGKVHHVKHHIPHHGGGYDNHVHKGIHRGGYDNRYDHHGDAGTYHDKHGHYNNYDGRRDHYKYSSASRTIHPRGYHLRHNRFPHK